MAGELPKLAVLWEDAAFSPLQIAEAARGLCRPVFVIGWSGPEVSFPTRILRRLGEVVEVNGYSPEEVALALAPLRPAGLVVFTDVPQCLGAAVAEQLGLPFHSQATALMVSDKLAQRRALEAAGLRVPGYWPVVRSQARRPSAWPAALRFPAVLKPRRGAGSRDTFLVHDKLELGQRMAECAEEELVVEEYIPDLAPLVSSLGSDVFSVETIVEDGRPHHLASTGRFRFTPPFRESGAFLPSDIPAAVVAEAFAMAGAAAEALGVKVGVLHTEIKLSPWGPVLVEVNGRTGGNIPTFLGRVGGPPIMVLAMRVALGLGAGAGQLSPVNAGPVAFVRFVRAPLDARRVVEVSGLEELRAVPGVDSVRLRLQPGEKIPWGTGADADYVLEVDGQAPDHEALRTGLEVAMDALRVEYSD